MEAGRRLLICGASTRAAGWSARRAGIPARTFDLFADTDAPPGMPCTRLAELSLAELLPQLTTIARADPAVRLLPVGGWENRPELLAELNWPLSFLGTNPANMHKARAPEFLFNSLSLRHLPALPIRCSQSLAEVPLTMNAMASADNSRLRTNEHTDSGNLGSPQLASREQADRSWIRKAIHSAGGLTVLRLPAADLSLPAAGWYDQREQPGIPCSAQFLTRVDSRGIRITRLLGLTRQLIGDPRLPEFPFMYLGNEYPLANFLDDSQEAIAVELCETMQAIGTACAEDCELLGLWGFDFILTDGIPYLVEINPRYTAAMELLELTERRSLLREWLEPESPRVSPRSLGTSPLPRLLSKRILYADQETRWPDALPRDWLSAGPNRSDPWRLPILTDIPAAGTPFRRGDPICTIWATGSTPESCRTQLQTRMQTLLESLKQGPFVE